MSTGYLIVEKTKHSWKSNTIIGLELDKFKARKFKDKGYLVFEINLNELIKEEEKLNAVYSKKEK